MLLIFLVIHILIGLFCIYFVKLDEIEKNGYMSRGDFILMLFACFLPLANLLIFGLVLVNSTPIQEFLEKPLFKKA